MNLPLDIAKRYLFSKKSTNAINLITGISVLGISIGTAVLIIILSVFNGFEAIFTRFLDSFNPDIKVVPVDGKYFTLSDEDALKIEDIPGVLGICKTLEEVVIFEYKGKTRPGTIKGVDANFTKVIQIDNAISNGTFSIATDPVSYTTIGDGVATELGIHIGDRLNPLTIYFPKRKKSVLGKEFSDQSFYLSGTFKIQNESDYTHALVAIKRAEDLLGRRGQITAIEVDIDEHTDIEMVQSKIENILGDQVVVKDRYAQDSTYLKVMNIEKWISFLIVGLTIIIIAFNMIGCLWMIILDKKRDIATLKSMGATDNSVKNIFLNVGILITLLGIAIGIILALLLYFLQVNYGLISIAEGFIIDSYPIELKITDFVIVFFTVFVIGLLASLGPAAKAKNIPAFIREE